VVTKDPSTLPEGDKKSIAPDENVVFKDLCNRLKKWRRNAFILRVIHVSLIIITTVSSVYVVTTVDSNLNSNSLLATPTTTATAALIAAVSAALFAGLDLGSKSIRVRWDADENSDESKRDVMCNDSWISIS
jgi:hypothetical protein